MDRKHLRILFLEDSEEDATAVIRLLIKAGYHIDHDRVETEAGFRYALESFWDVIIADYDLPGWTGVEALQVYKAKGLDIPFIIVSGLIDEETAVAAMKSGAHDFITKGRLGRLVPVMERELHETRIREFQRRADKERALLSEAGRLLAMPLDYEAILAGLARTVVGRFADWCLIDIADEAGRLHRSQVVHADAEKQSLVERLRDYSPSDPRNFIAEVFQSGLPLVVSTVTPEILARSVPDPEHREIIKAVGCTSFICVPLIASGRNLGVLTFCSSNAASCYTDRDLDLAIELSRRAAILIDNARLYQQAREANRLKDQFLAMVSHELRTPLTPILGAVYMIKANLDNQSMLEKAVDVIERNAKIQSQIVDDLLDISRIVSGKFSLKEELVDLPGVVSSAVNTIRATDRGSQMVIESFLGPVHGTVVGDTSRLQQILGILLSNATKFTPPGGKIAVSLRQPAGDRIQFVVSDTGKGISPEFLPYVFDRFRQADATSTRSTGGLGLGLAIARDIVELHGGEIHAHSEGLGKGATFVVDLPVRADSGSAG